MKKLTVHENKRYLMWEDGTPFFYLGDTAWELFHKLNREEATEYLGIRASQGFNVIQAVLLAEMDGIRTPNAYGRFPLLDENPESPDTSGEYSYWDHVDYIVDAAEELELLIALLPTWGDKFNQKWGKGPEIFTPENAYHYGAWLGKRYKDKQNIIWMLGGDRPLESENHQKIIDAMAEGIRSEDPNHLMTFHPVGDYSSADFVAEKEYMDFHGIQSGHNVTNLDNHRMLLSTMAREEKPCLDLEPRYEDHPACFRPHYGLFWEEADVRESAYWAVLSGTCGHTYGNHSVWSMTTEPDGYFIYHWRDVLRHPGAEQMGYLKELRLSRPYFEFYPAPELIAGETAVNAYQPAGRGEKYAFIYSPLGMPIRVRGELLGGFAIKASWMNPRTGEVNPFTVVPPKEALFVPPTSGKGQDWVLILDVMEE